MDNISKKNDMVKKEYTIGLDIGTNSVGWAVIDENNDLVVKNRHSMWGVRMFEGSSDARNRRTFRNARRRYKRRKERILLLQDIFKDEINKVDPNFFTKLNESYFLNEDKTIPSNELFVNYQTNSEYYKKYPTIWHLRKALISENKKFDIREVYLALHHIIKYRGNFLNEGFDIEKLKTGNDFICKLLCNFRDLIEEQKETLINELGSEESDEDIANYFKNPEIDDDEYYKLAGIIETIILDNSFDGKENKTKKDKKNNFNTLLKDSPYNLSNTVWNEFFAELIISKKRKLTSTKFSNLKNLEEASSITIDFESENFDSDIVEAKSKIRTYAHMLDAIIEIKKVSDYVFLKKIIGESATLSEAMINRYNVYDDHLKFAKTLLKKYLPEDFEYFFNNKEKKGIAIKTTENYAQYTGFYFDENGNKNKELVTLEVGNKVKSISKTLGEYLVTIKNNNQDSLTEEEKEWISILENAIDKDELFLKTRTGSNGTLPMQLHREELNKILKNQSKFYSFLDRNNINKIQKIFEFKRDYFVGPLKAESPFSWAVLKDKNNKIYPWNFEEKVDLDDSARKFIERMLNKCTYLKGEDDFGLPKCSLYYQKYIVLQYLNKIKIGGKFIDLKLRDKIFKDIFLQFKKPTKKKIIEYITTYDKSIKEDDIIISDCDVSMSSYLFFNKIEELKGKIFQSGYLEFVEQIILDSALFQNKKYFEKRAREHAKNFNITLSEESFALMKAFNSNKFGRLCKNLLTEIEITNIKTGQVYHGILKILEDTNLNLMEIYYSNSYNLQEAISNYNKINSTKKDGLTFSEYVEENIAISPIWFRSFNQAYKIICEIRELLGENNIFKYAIECTRENNTKEKKKATKSRYENLKELYKSIELDLSLISQKDFDSVKNKLHKEENLNRDKLFLYYTQLGKDAYTLETIDINQLDSYDIDHIYPRSVLKDDSILKNKVLVKKDINEEKDDTFLPDVKNPKFNHQKISQYAKFLYKNKLISKDKMERLTETEIDQDVINSFIDRQKVATDQAVTAVIKALKEFDGVDGNSIIYSKAGIISEFRKLNRIYKSRELNNHHHAHDAYLNAFIGKTLKVYFDYNGRFIKSYYDLNINKKNEYTYNPENILGTYKRKAFGTDKIIWNGKEDINKIKNTIFNNFDIKETRMCLERNGFLTKVTIDKKGNGVIPTKQKTPNGNDFDIAKYGGYEAPAYLYFKLVETTKKNEKNYYLIPFTKIGERNSNEYVSNLLGKTIKNWKFVTDKHIKINTVMEYNKTLTYLASVKNKGKVINRINKIDRNACEKIRFIVFKIERIIDRLKNKKIDFKNFLVNENALYIYKPNEFKDYKDYVLTLEDLNTFLEYFINLYKNNFYSFTNHKEFVTFLESIILPTEVTFEDFVKLLEDLYSLLVPLKTNKRDVIKKFKLLDKYATIPFDFNFGEMFTSYKLNNGTKLIIESPTGFKKRVLFEVK